jgi:hypothetical protein
MNKKRNIFKEVAMVTLFAALLFTVSQLLGSDDPLIQYAFIGAIGDFFGGGGIEDAIHGQRGTVMDNINKAMERLYSEFDRDREQWKQGYKKLESGWRDMTAEAKAELSEAHAGELGYLQTGREDALQQIRMMGEQRLGSELAAQQQSGLAQTSFGRGMMGAIESGTGMQSAQLETQYNLNLAQATGRQGSEMLGLNQWAAKGATELGRTNIAGMSALSQNWMGQIMSGESMRGGFSQNFANQIIGNEQQNVASGMNILGGVMGGLGF